MENLTDPLVRDIVLYLAYTYFDDNLQTAEKFFGWAREQAANRSGIKSPVLVTLAEEYKKLIA